MAFERAHGRCVFSSEWDKFSQQTYFANFKEKPHGDITQIDERCIPKFEVLVAGFPCQPFSTIGKRQGFSHKTQGTMFHEVVRIMRHHKNRAFLLENVSGIRTHNGGRTLKTIEESLAALNYTYDYRVLDAADFGVPQYRSRIYIVGYKSRRGRRSEFNWPEGNKTHRAIGPFIESGIQGHSITKHLQKVYLFKKDDGRPQIVDKSSDFPVKTLVASYHKIQRLTGTFVHDDETGLRLLSQNECKAIMGFNKRFKVPVSRTQMYKQFGNSVAVPVVTALAKWIAAEFLDD